MLPIPSLHFFVWGKYTLRKDIETEREKDKVAWLRFYFEMEKSESFTSGPYQPVGVSEVVTSSSHHAQITLQGGPIKRIVSMCFLTKDNQ